MRADPENLRILIKKVEKWLLRARWRKAIWCSLSTIKSNRLNLRLMTSYLVNHYTNLLCMFVLFFGKFVIKKKQPKSVFCYCMAYFCHMCDDGFYKFILDWLACAFAYVTLENAETK